MVIKINDEHERVVPEDEVKVSSFKSYPSSDDDRTKIIDGEKTIEDFHLYEEDDDDDDHDEE